MKKYLIIDWNLTYKFQCMFITEYDDGLKVITDIQEYQIKNPEQCYEKVLRIVTEQDIDYIMMDYMGSSRSLYEKITNNNCLNKKLISIVHNNKFTHEIIIKYINDLKNNKLSVISSTCDLSSFIDIENLNSNFYSHACFLKLNKFVSSKDRDVLHLILILYGCLLTQSKQSH